MTDEAAVAAFPKARFFMAADEGKPTAFAILVATDGSAWAFDKGPSPRPISAEEIKSLGARPCKPSDAVELIPPDAEIWPKPARNSLEVFSDVVKNLKPGEWQEHCERSDDAEDKALGRTGPSTSTFLETDSLQSPLELNESRRLRLRQQPEWMTCFRSWLESTSPNEIRDWLAGPEKELLEHLDQLTLSVWRIFLNSKQTPDDMAEALRQEIPMEDDEEQSPLSQQDRQKLVQLAENAHFRS